MPFVTLTRYYGQTPVTANLDLVRYFERDQAGHLTVLHFDLVEDESGECFIRDDLDVVETPEQILVRLRQALARERDQDQPGGWKYPAVVERTDLEVVRKDGAE